MKLTATSYQHQDFTLKYKVQRVQCFAYLSCLQAGFNLSRICGFFPPTLAKS